MLVEEKAELTHKPLNWHPRRLNRDASSFARLRLDFGWLSCGQRLA